MRDIRFRFWHSEEERMYEFDLLTYMATNEAAQEDLCPFGADRSPMQFIGTKDKNGVDIFEGDIVKRHFEFWTDPADLGGRQFIKQDKIYQIKWGTWSWVKEERGCTFTKSFDPIEARECEVIGNIHQNPELLQP